MNNISNIEQPNLIAAEELRCKAWLGEDVSPLSDLLADDIYYVHTNGKRDDKAGLFEVAKVGWVVRRESLEVRVYGDTAVMTGLIVISARDHDPATPPPEYRSHGLQVWRKRAGRWQLVAQQSTPAGS